MANKTENFDSMSHLKKAEAVTASPLVALLNENLANNY
jgi:hypothetical protein